MRQNALERVRSALALAPALLLCTCCGDSALEASPGLRGSQPAAFGAGSGALIPSSLWTAAITREVRVGMRYRQGLARVAGGWIFSYNDGLFRTDDRDVELAALAPAIPDAWKAKGYDHIGDIDVQDGVVYAPLEQPDYEQGRQAILLYDARTLQFQSGFEVAQHENSFLSVDAEPRIAYSLDRFGGAALLRYDVVRNWLPLPPLALSKFVDKVQGADVALGALWLACDDERKSLTRVDLATGQVDDLGSIGHLDGETEGIDATPGPSGLQLRVLSLDRWWFQVRAIDVSVRSLAD